NLLGTPVVIGNKQREDHSEQARVLEVIGEVKDKNVLIVDDFATTGRSLISMTELLKERGANDVYAAVTHGILSKGAASRIEQSDIKQMFITDTIEPPVDPLPKNIGVILQELCQTFEFKNPCRAGRVFAACADAPPTEPEFQGVSTPIVTDIVDVIIVIGQGIQPARSVVLRSDTWGRNIWNLNPTLNRVGSQGGLPELVGNKVKTGVTGSTVFKGILTGTAPAVPKTEAV
ncbi:MAG: hypothetical protein IIB03_10975, partial [Acidobacteria bacterium]|nr:hypothetical protein [Acidobacteriota bacterium]